MSSFFSSEKEKLPSRHPLLISDLQRVSFEALNSDSSYLQKNLWFAFQYQVEWSGPTSGALSNLFIN